ncbi:MAG: hypothetical protein QM831_25545 [Kofleriaceae bacterium]
MQAVVPTCLLVGVIAACHGVDPGTGPDAGGTSGSDGSVGGGIDRGLTIAWKSKPSPIPGDVNGDISLTSMVFRLSNLRVIGDAGFDDRTSINTVELDWKQGQKPDEISFKDAPIGLYSRVILLAGGTVEYAYEIAGTVKMNGDPKPFVIHDLTPLGATMETSVMLDVNSEATLDITVDIDQALTSLNYATLNDVNGTLTLDTFDDQMSDFRDKLMNNVFGADESSTDDGSGGPH